MVIEVFNRFEKKYIITDDVYHKIKSRLEEYMEADSHSKKGEFYSICNVYYDTLQNDIIRRSIEKPLYKEKLRLRSYGTVTDTDKVYFELKKKFQGHVNKRRTVIYLKDAYEYVATKKKPEVKPFMNGQVVNEIYDILHRYELKPTLFLSYDRNAMFDKEDQRFRVTFDCNIRTRRYDVGLEYGIYGDMLLPEEHWIMEVKMPNAAPLWLAKLLSELQVYPSSYSKYGNEYQKYIMNKKRIDMR